MEKLAHIREDKRGQPLIEHLKSVAEGCALKARKFDLPKCGHLIGLLHDLGKYSSNFQNYICSGSGLIDADDAYYIDPISNKGHIDHSTAGAQLIKALSSSSITQILEACVVSHHSGLIDMVGGNRGDRKSKYEERLLNKSVDDYSSYIEDLPTDEIRAALNEAIDELKVKIRQIADIKDMSNSERAFNVGNLTKMLFSCLVDADRLDAQFFEYPMAKMIHTRSSIPWEELLNRLHGYKNSLGGPSSTVVKQRRSEVYSDCLEASTGPRGVYSLTVPTGGGKTISSMAFALSHASHHSMDRVIYVCHYLSIIDQNAKVIRDALTGGKNVDDILLEHHSNIVNENCTWKHRTLAENWNSKVVYTTMVQLLESMFSNKTRSARRMHQLANSVIIFDEAQNLPAEHIQIFNGVVNFLVNHCGSTVLICTATQPLLHDKNLLQICLKKPTEIVKDVDLLFSSLVRNTIEYDHTKVLSSTDLLGLLIKKSKSGSCLCIVNTKNAALNLYELTTRFSDIDKVYHLSTNMCPAHRMDTINSIRKDLSCGISVVCISTQLIEAGVDMDFDCVIRTAAGLDSVIQAAGRCNRNGKKDTAEVIVVNVDDEFENTEPITSISIGKKHLRLLAQRIPGIKLDSLYAIAEYYKGYYGDDAVKVFHKLKPDGDYAGADILDVLSFNRTARCRGNAHKNMHLRQDFDRAGKSFKVIDDQKIQILVSYGRSKEIIDYFSRAPKEASKIEPKEWFKNIREAQKYSVGISEKEFSEMNGTIVVPVQDEDLAIYCLVSNAYYKHTTGLAKKPSPIEEAILHV